MKQSLGSSLGFIDPTMLRTSKYSTLSGAKTGEKFSFGKATRFPSHSANLSKELQRSKSSPAWSAEASTTASVADGLMEASQDFTSAEPSRVLSTEASVQEPARPSSGAGALVDSDDDEFVEGFPDSPTRHPLPPDKDRLQCPRLDSSLERLGDPQQRSAHPRAHSYDPAQTLGPGTSDTFQHSPHYSFGGGPSRVNDPSKKEHLAHLLCTSSTKKGKISRAALTMMDLKDAIKPDHKPQAPLSRGFGSQARGLALKAGPMALGPGAYELMRLGDLEPVWMRSKGNQCIWSTRTCGRSDLRNRIGTGPNLAPGDSITEETFQFKAGGPTPVFGHPLTEYSKPEWQGSDPSHYNVASSLCRDRSPIHSVGTGKRPGAPPARSPGPAQYRIKDDVRHRSQPAVSFGKSTRIHECELVDPDEPPGPGAHTVRVDPKVADKPSTGLPKDAKMRETFLQRDTKTWPSPGDWGGRSAGGGTLPSSLEKGGRSMGIHLPRTKEERPGPADTAGWDPYTTDSLCVHSGPSWGSLVNRSDVRKPPWRQIEQPPVFELKSGEKLIMTNVPIQFKSGGPKWSLMPRRAQRRDNTESEAMIMASSIG